MTMQFTQRDIDLQTAKARAGWRRYPGPDSQTGTPLPGPPPLKEKDITRQIRDTLKVAGVFHWKVHQGLGSTPGISDILGIYKGRLLAIEVKAGKGRLTPQQAKFLKRVNSEGGIGIVCYSVDSMIGQLGLKLPLFEQCREVGRCP